MKTLQGLGQGVMKSFQDARIGETIESGVNSVRAKLNDPAFQKDVKEKAQAGWSWLSSTAGSIWSAAKEAATQIASELNDDNAGQLVKTAHADNKAAGEAQAIDMSGCAKGVYRIKVAAADRSYVVTVIKK